VNIGIFRLALGCVAVLWLSLSYAEASPWAEVGDPQLRSDIEILASAGVIDDITTHWPIPWAGVVTHLRDDGALLGQPDYVREAARRVLRHAQEEMRFDTLHVQASADATNLPDPVRGFDGMSLGDFQGQVSAEYMSHSTAIRLSAGALVDSFNGGKTHFMPDGSYIAQSVGGAVVYAGYLTHWWGPGWISALSLSNNARPFPQVGIARLGTSAFDSSWLSWIGPWQMEFFVGWLDGPRIAKNTLYNGLRVTFNPLPGLQIGLARTEEFCGEGHPCKPVAYYFDFSNDPAHPDHTNDEGVIDLHYTNDVGGLPYEVYMQVMNEDSNPISHSLSSHLFGASTWVPLGRNTVRLTAEYTDSVPTIDIFSFGDVQHGVAYTNYSYTDGMRYRDRTLGFSLDSDSRLLSLQAAWTDDGDRSYTLTYHHADVSNPLNTWGNVVTTAPVKINIGEARLTIPMESMKLDLAARVQDDQLRPDHGFTGAFEARLSVDL
jgi:hypothetical protein